MNTVGIIAAMAEEMAEIEKIMTEKEEVSVYGKTFVKGKIRGVFCVLSLSGVGKVNAARTAQIIIERFGCGKIINVGSAGALTKEQKIGDIVLSQSAVQSDFDLTAFGREKGFITDVGKYINADEDLIAVFEKAIKNSDNSVTVRKGIVASADRFVNNCAEKTEINKEFSALCCEMEGAAIALVCYLCKIPFVIIRSISDELGSKAEVDFDKYLTVASKKCAEFLSSAFEFIN